MRHFDAIYHVRGESQYVDDIPQPAGMLHAAVFASPVAHGRILDISTDKVGAGAVVFTAADIPGDNQIGPIIADETLLAVDSVHFVGQPVALAVASTPEEARRAVGKIEMKFSELPVIVDPREAYARGEIIGTPRTFSLGDVDSAWATCDVIVEGRCDSAGQEHAYLETQRARAIPREGGKMLLYSSTQAPYTVQRMVAKILGIPLHSVEIDVKRLGGGFGGKEDQANAWSCLAALAAWRTRRPVELVLSRLDDIKMTGKRHPYSSDFKLGATKDGKILAYQVKFYQNSGASADLSTAILERTLFHGTNAYFVPNARISAACCRTNLPPNTAMRGFGAPQAMFAMECAIAKLSRRLNLPREELQYRNLLQENDVFPYGQRAQNPRARKTWEKAVKIYDLPQIRQSVEEYNRQHFETKKGFALMPICFGISFTTTFLNQASALMHVYTDGSVSVTTGGIEMGQGLSANLARIAALALGVSQHRISVESTNTARVANTPPTAASSGTHLNGNAVLLAAKQIVDRLKLLVAKEIGIADLERVIIEDEKVLYSGHDTGWTWTSLVQKAYFSRTSLSAHSFYATPEIWFDKTKEKGCPFAYHVFGTAVIEVVLDCIRGTYDIDSVKIVHDLGRPINKIVDQGQIEGGLAQGLGWMTIEDLCYNDKGQYRSYSLATYKAPDVYFMPDHVQIEFLEETEPKGPYGARAVGEPPLMYGIGVFFAIRHAMQAFHPGREFAFHSPLTPERVLLQLHSQYHDSTRQIPIRQESIPEL